VERKDAAPGDKAQNSQAVVSERPTNEDAKSSDIQSASGLAERSKILLYLRDEQTVDIDSALKESRATAPFSRDLWERLRGKTARENGDDWEQGTEIAPEVPSQVAQKKAVLAQAKHELDKASAMRARTLKTMRQAGTSEEDHRKRVELTSELFRWDRVMSGRQILVLLANVDLLFEQLSVELETKLQKASIVDWDISGRNLKLLVLEFSLLDKQVAPYQRFVKEDPEVVRAAGLDCDELRMLEAHIARIAGRLGLEVERINQSQSMFGPLQKKLSTMDNFIRRGKRGIMFYANGMRLLYQDLQHALKLVLKVVCLNYTLEPRELKVCYRAVKDLVVLVPVLIILLIPLSPPGHVLVFSLILKVYPDFFPSPFTERRQNVMRIYNEIKPASEQRQSWT